MILPTPEKIDSIGRIVVPIALAVLAMLQKGQAKELESTKKDLDCAYEKLRFLLTGEHGLIRGQSRTAKIKESTYVASRSDPRKQSLVEEQDTMGGPDNDGGSAGSPGGGIRGG